jgi:hypothetical protein
MPTLALVLWATVAVLVVAVAALFALVCSARRQLRTCVRCVPAQRAFDNLQTAVRRHQLALDRQAQLLRRIALRVPRAAPDQLQTWRQVRPSLTGWEDDYDDTRRSDTGETFLPVSFEHDLW